MMNFRLLSSLLLPALLAACSGGGQDQRSNLQDIFEPGAQISAQQRSMVYAFPAPGQTEVIPLTPIALRFSHPIGAEFKLEDLKELFTLCEEVYVVDGKCTSTGKVEFDAKFSKKAKIDEDGEPIFEEDAPEEISKYIVRDDDRHGVVLRPKSPLKEKTQYRIISNDLMLDTGELRDDGTVAPGDKRNVAVQAANVGQPLIFTTRAALEGPVNARSTSLTKFDVEHITPNPESFLLGNEGLGLFNYSTIRLQMTQPVDIKTLVYGDSIKLTNDATGNVEQATVLVNGNQISIDPNADLDPTKTYTLSINSKLKSLKGMAFQSASRFNAFQFQPIQAADGESALSEVPDLGISILLGDPINQVPVASPLLGQGERATKAQSKGYLVANLGTPANIKNIRSAVAPLRVKRNSELTAASLIVKLDGVVPANLETKPLTIKLIADANGLLLPNRYSLSPFAPSLVTLEMDVAFSAEDPTSNGAFTQNIMHVPVSGIARFNTKENKILIDAIGMLELKVLGVDNAIGELALQLVVDLNASPSIPNPKEPTNPIVQSWVPGTNIALQTEDLRIPLVDAKAENTGPVQTVITGPVQVEGGELMRPGDPVIVNFDQVMDVESFRSPGSIKLQNDGAPIGFSWRLDGASLVITPDTPFKHDVSYTVILGSTIKSLDGKSLTLPSEVGAAPGYLTFKMPALAAGDATPKNDNGSDTRRPPVVLGVYPGYPCGVMSGTRDVAGGWQGKCAGGKTSDEKIPLPSIDARRDITVTLSQTVHRTGAHAVKLGTMCNDPNASFRVERISAAGVCIEKVDGTLGGTSRELRFTPDEPWDKTAMYRYVLGSSGLDKSSCTANSICGTNNLPLQTQMISQSFASVSNPHHGGPPMEIFFKVLPEPAKGSPINLRLLPNADVDANFLYEPARGEKRPSCFNNAAIDDLGQNTGSCDTPNGALLLPDTSDGLRPPDYKNNNGGKSFSGAASSLALGCPRGKTGGICEDKQFLRASSALSATLIGYKKDNGAPLVPADFEFLCTGASTSGGIDVLIDPGLIVTNGVDIYAELGLSLQASPVTNVINELINLIPILGPILTGAISQGADLLNQIVPIVVEQPLNTGPLVFRMRHVKPDLAAGPREITFAAKIPGKIIGNCDKLGADGKPSNPTLETSISLYTDIPEINARADVGLLKTLTDLGIPVLSDVTGLVGIPIDQDARSNDNIKNLKVSGTVEFLPDGRLAARLVNVDRVRLAVGLSALGGLMGGNLYVTVPPKRFVLNSALAPVKQ